MTLIFRALYGSQTTMIPFDCTGK